MFKESQILEAVSVARNAALPAQADVVIARLLALNRRSGVGWIASLRPIPEIGKCATETG
jgi:hypothetical protein